MQRDEIIEMARQAQFHEELCGEHFIYEFAKLVAAKEREACARVCDDFERAKWESVKHISENGGRLAFAGPMKCAIAIRARGEA
jgi:hypothetical protein